MIIETRIGKAFDTERDLTAPERHILQKLIIWESLATSPEEFRRKKAEALNKGWSDSGPIPESAAMKAIVSDMEEKVCLRLKKENQS
jgi:hypothetical protein